MFNRKINQIKKLTKAINNSTKNQKENINDFILILKNIQETNNAVIQWKRRQKTINNIIDLSIEKLNQKIVELDIDPQY